MRVVAALADLTLFQHLIQHSGEGAGAGAHGGLGLGDASGEGLLALAQCGQLVGDVECGEDGDAE